MTAITRREFLGGAMAGMAVVLARRSDASSNPSSGPWSFTDDRGVKVSLKSQPKRIVAYDLAAAALMNIGLNCVGIMASWPLTQDPELSGLNLKGVATVSSSYANLNLEVLAETQPDVIVTIFDPRLTGPVIGFSNTATQSKAEQLAPIIAINSIKDITVVINRFEQLGHSLGVDIQGPLVTSVNREFSTASASVKAATSAKPGIKVIALAAYQGAGVSFCRPNEHPTFRLYEKLGIDMVPITSKPGNINTDYNSFFYERDSFELFGKYPADLILYSDIPGAMTPKQLASVPTWASLPAVKAGQLLPWRVLDPFSYKVLSLDSRTRSREPLRRRTS